MHTHSWFLYRLSISLPTCFLSVLSVSDPPVSQDSLHTPSGVIKNKIFILQLPYRPSGVSESPFSARLPGNSDISSTQTPCFYRILAISYNLMCHTQFSHRISHIIKKKKFPASIQTGVSHTLLSKRFLSGSKTLFPHQTSKTSCFLTSPCFLIDFLYSNILYFLTDFLFPWKFPIKRISISYKTSRFHTYSQSGL